jgi:DNA-binding transcriptional LysR family regulator
VDTRQLAAFVAVVERGSFSQAAEALGVTQPAISLAVRALERRLGEKLLDRSGRRMEPTSAGRTVFSRAQRILQLEAEIGARLREQAETLQGSLVVGASTGPGARLLPRLLVGFRQAHPDVAVSLHIDSTQTVIDRVLGRELELGVVGAERRHRSLEYEPFLADEIVLAVPPRHPFAGRTIGIDELRSAPLILQQEGSGIRALMERELRRVGIRPRDLDVIAELGLQESSRTAVEQGLGVTFTSRASMASELALGILAEARVEGVRASRNYMLVRPVTREPSRLTETFLRYCRAELQRTGAVARADALEPLHDDDADG